jgi:hypothetical protein
MRKYLTILFLTFLSLHSLAQKIVRAEYFIDIDPSPGKGTPIIASKYGDSISVNNNNIPTTGLSNGSHLLGVRVRDSLGMWSPTVINPFNIQNAVSSLTKPNVTKLVRAEYFIDIDPSPGKGVPIIASKYGDSIAVNNINISTSGLSIGSHLLGVRVRDSLGIWSPTVINPFNIQNAVGSLVKPNLTKLVRAEYFIDIDPSPGKGIPIIASKYGDSITVNNINISTTGLAIGSHLLGVRARDSLGNWSPTVINPFNIQNAVGSLTKLNLTKLVRAEYFIDIDPSPGKGVPITASKFGDSIAVNDINIPTTGLSIGSHLLGVRVKDSLGIWSPTVINPFNIQNAGSTLTKANLTKIKRAEYFIDIDPSPGKGIAIIASKYGDSISVNDINIPTTGLSIGSHLIGVRVQDSLGIWSPTNVSPFNILQTNTDTNKTKLLLRGEYFFGKNDPGYGNGIAFTSLPTADTSWEIPNLNIKLPDSIGGSNTPDQANYFTFRLKQSNGLWTANQTVSFDVCFKFPSNPPVSSNATICGGSGTSTLTASGAAGNKYIWFDNSWGSKIATYSNSSSIYTTPNLTQSRSYWVAKDTTGACQSNRTKVQIDVVKALNTPTASNINRCGQGVATLAASGAPIGGTFRWYDSNTATNWLAEGATYRTDTLTEGTNYWVSSVSNGGKCESTSRKQLSVGILKCDSQTVVFLPIQNQLLKDNFVILKAFATPSNLPIQYDVILGANNVSLSNDTLYLLDNGTVSIRARQLGNDKFYEAKDQFVTFKILSSSDDLGLTYNRPVCTGGEIKLVSNYFSDGIYFWTGPNDFTINVQSPSLYNATFADSGKYTLTIRRTVQNDTLVGSILVKVYPSPKSINLFSVQKSLCARDYQLFTTPDKQLGQNDSIVAYQWFYNAKRLFGYTDSTFKPTFTGVYSVTGFNKYGCPVSSQPIYVNVDADSVPVISRLRNPSRLRAPLAEGYQWYVDNYYIASSNKQEIPLVFNGTYKVKITDSKGCEKVSPAYTINDDGLASLRTDMVASDGSVSLDIYDAKILHVQPVPASDIVELGWLSPKRGVLNIKILDAFGKQVLELTNQKDQEYYRATISVNNLASGVYSVLVQCEDKSVTSKIVVSK